MRLDFGKFAIVGVSTCALLGASAAVAAALSLSKPAEEPALPAPTTISATVKADGVLVHGPLLMRGEELSNVEDASELSGSYAGSYYRASYKGAIVYVAKSSVRTADEAPYEQWMGYAASDAIIFARPDFTGEDLLTLSLNEEVTVLDAFGSTLFVRNKDGYEGYIPADKIMREKAEEEQPAASGSNSSSVTNRRPNASGGSSSSNSGSGSGGSGASKPSTPPPSSGGNSGNSGSGGSDVDGDEMTLPVSFTLPDDPFLFGVGVAYAAEPGADEVEIPEGWTAADGARGPAGNSAEDADPGLTGVVLVDDTQVYVAMLNRDDVVTVKIDELFDFEERDIPALESAENEDGADGSSKDAASQEDAAKATDMQMSPEDMAEAGSARPDADDLCTIEINGQEAQLPEKLLRLEGEPAYEAWTGYALEGAVLYADYELKASAREVELNYELHVVDAIDEILLIELDGETFYVSQAFAGKDPVEVIEEEVEEEAESPSSGSSSKPSGNRGGSGSSSGGTNSSGSSSGTNSGGSSSSGSSGSTSGNTSSGSGSSGSDAGSSGGDEWTAPKL